MAKFTLSIETEDAAELSSIVDRIAGAQREFAAPSVTEDARPVPEKAPAATKKATATKTAAASAPTQESPAPESPLSVEADAPANSTAAAPEPAANEPEAGSATAAEFQKAMIELMKSTSAANVTKVLMESVKANSPASVKPEQYGKAVAALKAALNKAGG